MTSDLRREFVEITARLEALHGISVEGQHRDNSPDMLRVLIAHLRSGVSAMDGRLRTMSAAIDRRSR